MAPASKNITDVNLEATVAQARILRGKFEVPVTVLNDDALKAIGDLNPAAPKSELRVISQSVAPGTTVAAGASVGITLAPRGGFSLGYVDGGHASLTTLTVGDVDVLFGDNGIRLDLLSHDTPGDVPEADQKAIEKVVKGQLGDKITIDESKPGQTFADLYRSLRVAVAFGVGDTPR
jgi:hypothetical protein